MNTFQLNLVMRSETTYAQFYYRSLDTNEIEVEEGFPTCYGQVEALLFKSYCCSLTVFASLTSLDELG